MERSLSSDFANPASILTTRESETDSTAASFAFLVHSQDTIPRNLPPSVDNKSLARQRRRRTSPEDQAILEAEFRRDSKPDKEARRHIVERVALGEKEVQIWFQNRRQNKRRKSQPPVSYEILPRLEPASDDSPPSFAYSVSNTSTLQDPSSTNDSTNVLAASFPASASSSQSIRIIDNSDGDCEAHKAIAPSQAREGQPSTTSEGIENLNQETRDAVSFTSVASTPTLERIPSRVRLSMTSSGGAKVIYGAESTPSPPRSQPLAPTPFATRQTLRRSYSAAGFQEASDGRGNFANLLKRKPSGRSRDSRAWEFWCDSDARNGLVKKAEQETTGSAADAIGLMRSSSGRRRSGVLTPNLSRVNPTVLARGQSGTKRAKKAHQDDWTVDIDSDRMKVKGSKTREMKLKRAMSSVARLQGGKHDPIFDAGSVSSKGDSDKENLEPNGAAATDGTRRLPHDGTRGHGRRAILGESRTVPSMGSRPRHGLGIRVNGVLQYGKHFNQAPSARAQHGSRHPSTGPEDDEEVTEFMRAGRGSEADRSSVSVESGPGNEEDDEMDCVAGLLSLSQGNWR